MTAQYLYEWRRGRITLRNRDLSMTSLRQSSLSDALHSDVARGRPLPSRIWVHHFSGGWPRGLGFGTSRWHARATWLFAGLRATCPNHVSLLVLIMSVSVFFICKAILTAYSVAQLHTEDGSQTLHFKCLQFPAIFGLYGPCLGGVHCNWNDERFV